jgi:hypothetical protein
MRRVDPQDYYTPVQPTIAGPLFDSNPFDHSPLGQPSSDFENIVAKLIWQHQGRHNPISIERIRANVNLSERAVKGIVSSLRTDHHMPIGAIRGASANRGPISLREETAVGYFWVIDAEDREIAVAPYRGQILTMWNTLRRLDSPANLRALREEMTVEDRLG